MYIETERLLLREMTENDFDALYKVLGNSDIMQLYPCTFDEARVKEWINRNIERYQIFGFGLWAVCIKETGEMIGDCGLTMQLINGQIKPEIGSKTAISYGCKQVDEFEDEINEITKVYAISRDEWLNLI